MHLKGPHPTNFNTLTKFANRKSSNQGLNPKLKEFSRTNLFDLTGSTENAERNFQNGKDPKNGGTNIP